MMAWVHAAVGAALGGRVGNKPGALAGGVASHLICDLLPHRDYEMPVELPLLAGTMGFIAWRYGARSTQMAGAVGAILPDIENGLERLNIVSGTLFPTHTKQSWFIGHGRKVESPLPQVCLAALCLLLAEK
ncbi:MAG TPA: hypothetical protein VFW40_03570 [Capsulimonadaceae bacterium]|nr:hypothetical protein [Capsulimonadaceae bacterium]